jgi:molybdate/tungstate transport system substrate-binding protein
MKKRNPTPATLFIWPRAMGIALLLLVFFAARAFGASPAQDQSVSVLYAGSLATVMENGIGPAFMKETGYTYHGEAQGSLGAAQLLRNHLRRPDVFISADPLVNTNFLLGPQNGNVVRWFVVFASSQLVLAYNPRSKFSAKFEEAAANKVPWYEVLATPGLRFGRGDPTVDPKGYRTFFMFGLAARYYHRNDIPKLLGQPLDPAQTFPEVVLLARVESGQFDAGIFYKHEIIARQLPYISFPEEINLGAQRLSELYALESYTTPSGEQISGAPILFTVSIPEAARDREAAVAFVRFLLTHGQLLKQFGFGEAQHLTGGDAAQIPAELRGLTSGVFKP